jgi:hypothetical protein
MKDVVIAMIYKYGPENVLSDIARGFASEADGIHIDTEHNKLLKKCCNDAATAIFQARNEVRKVIK